MPADAAAPRERLRGDGLRVIRGGKAILRGVSIDAAPGEVLGVVGPSGAGKSTLFRALVGELPLAAGRVLLDGEDISAWPLWRRARAGIGYVPQTPSVLYGLTVRANLATYHRIVHGTDGDPAAAADRVDLASRLDVRAGELSAGERRRLELARAITRTPRILVCDEPFAGVDPVGASRIGDLLQGLARAGVSIVFADHHVAEVLAICTRAMLLLDGEVATVSDPIAFQDHPLVQGRYLGSWTRSIPPSVRPPRGGGGDGRSETR
jgi:lipopolysaccharide export system ATP-binding protein